MILISNSLYLLDPVQLKSNSGRSETQSSFSTGPSPAPDVNLMWNLWVGKKLNQQVPNYELQTEVPHNGELQTEPSIIPNMESEDRNKG